MANNGTRAALVTGANKGIGFETVRQLSSQFNGTVYLTARDTTRGKEAERTLIDEGLHNVKFLQMDVNDKKSIEKARDFIKEKHGGLDVLINNAAIFVKGAATPGAAQHSLPDTSAKAVKDTIATNVTGLLDVCNAFFPILRPHARVVNVSSSLSSLKHLKIDALKKQLVSDNLTVADCEKIAADYIHAAEQGDTVTAGYPSTYGSYTMSKIIVTGLSRVQQRILEQDKLRPDIVLNACCPGYVATDLNNHAGHKTTQQGADTPVYLALLPASSNGEPVNPHGQFVYERRVVNWAAGEDSY